MGAGERPAARFEIISQRRLEEEALDPAEIAVEQGLHGSEPANSQQLSLVRWANLLPRPLIARTARSRGGHRVPQRRVPGAIAHPGAYTSCDRPHRHAVESRHAPRRGPPADQRASATRDRASPSHNARWRSALLFPGARAAPSRATTLPDPDLPLGAHLASSIAAIRHAGARDRADPCDSPERPRRKR